MNYKGNSIVGDDKYKKKYKKLKNVDPTIQNSISKLNRQFLHAKTLGFVHPRTSKQMVFSSNLPKELNNILKILRNTKE
jgi:23S rRNA pseudouridine1911/1915/1917 synthase